MTCHLTLTDNAERELALTFYEDSLRYNAFDSAFAQPTMIFQRRHDRSVDPRTVEQFAAAPFPGLTE